MRKVLLTIAVVAATVLATPAMADKSKEREHPRPEVSASPSPSESESPTPTPTGTPTPTPTGTPTPTPTGTPTPTPTGTPSCRSYPCVPVPTPTATHTPTPTPTPTPTHTPTYVWPRIPREISGSDPKHNEIDVKEVSDKDTKTVKCGIPVTFTLSGPSDAVYTVLVFPRHGTLHVDDIKHTATWTPNKGYCQIGGNDGFVLRWRDSKGNTGIITKMIMLLRQGDVPSMIRTGV